MCEKEDVSRLDACHRYKTDSPTLKNYYRNAGSVKVNLLLFIVGNER